MLPILRILPVGGVLLAIVLLALALNPPAGPPAGVTPAGAPSRGAMIERSEHPEWPQFLMLAAIRRADELNRLRELPDTPAVMPPPEPKTAPNTEPRIAALPTERGDADPEDEDQTGTIMQPPAATIPVEIGEASTFELPVAMPEEKPPAVRMPQRARSHRESRIRRARHPHRIGPLARTQPKPLFNLFEFLFGDQKTRPSPAPGANTAAR